MLELRIAVEFAAVYTVGVAVVRCVGFPQLKHFLSFDFVVDAYDWLRTNSHKFGAICVVVQTVQLLVSGIGVILHGAETLS